MTQKSATWTAALSPSIKQASCETRSTPLLQQTVICFQWTRQQNGFDRWLHRDPWIQDETLILWESFFGELAWFRYRGVICERCESADGKITCNHTNERDSQLHAFESCSLLKYPSLLKTLITNTNDVLKYLLKIHYTDKKQLQESSFVFFFLSSQ